MIRSGDIALVMLLMFLAVSIWYCARMIDRLDARVTNIELAKDK
jgi:hypothetical protein